MIASTTNHADRASAASGLLDVKQVTVLLHSLLPRDWPGPVGDVAIERCWPSADDGFIAEWSFSLGSDRRFALYARSIDEAAGSMPATQGDASNKHQPTVTEWGLRGVLSYLPQHRLMIHTPDCDPAMRHLAKCLDEVRAAEFLAPFWEQAECHGAPSPKRLWRVGDSVSRVSDSRRTADTAVARGESSGVHCRLIGYKPGRRAAICFERKSRDGTVQRILGKTYHKRQAEQLARLHYQINDEFRKNTDGAVQVSSPVAYVPEMQLALFHWAPGEAAKEQSSGPAGSIATAVRTMAALHGTTLEGLATFTMPDECAILQRWHRALTGAHPRLASESAPLLAMLLQQSESIDSASRCTIHRDFYETQLVTFRGQTTLLDLDTLCAGHPCLDLGNFLAHLYLQLLCRGGGAEHFGHLLKETTEQYERIAGRVDREALDFYLNSSLFRLGTVHAFRTQTRGFAEPIWQLARERLETRAKGG